MESTQSETFSINKPSSLFLEQDISHGKGNSKLKLKVEDSWEADDGCVVEEVLSSSTINDAFDFDASFAWLTTLMQNNSEKIGENNEDRVIYDTDSSETKAQSFTSPKKRLKRSTEKNSETALDQKKSPNSQVSPPTELNCLNNRYLLYKSWYAFDKMHTAEPKLINQVVSSKFNLKFITVVQSCNGSILYEIRIPIDQLRDHIQGNATADECRLEFSASNSMKTYHGKAYDLQQVSFLSSFFNFFYFNYF